jgi:hypothetical protein
MSSGETYPKLNPGIHRNKVIKFKHSRAEKWDNSTNNQNLKMPLGELFMNDLWCMHAKFHEFNMHIKGDMNLSLFSFSEFCRMG